MKDPNEHEQVEPFRKVYKFSLTHNTRLDIDVMSRGLRVIVTRRTSEYLRG